jgi:hypothetical protein
MSDQPPVDEAFAADLALIGRLAEELRLTWWPGDPDTIVEIGDLENTSILAVRQGTIAVETTSRGRQSPQATFSSARDARRYLVLNLAEDARPTWMPPVVMSRLAPGCRLEQGPAGHRLSWPGGQARFRAEQEAVTFSWLIGAEPTAIVDSCRHLNGQPLFDFGVPADRTPPSAARRRPPPEPEIEAPPPDDETATDRAAIDALLTDLGMERQPRSGADVLVVGDRLMGRAIVYRRSRFVYESAVPPDYRNQRCAFSTAAAARRWMVVDLGSIRRTRTGMGPIRPNQLAPGCTLERTPAGWTVTWTDGTASFPAGIGRLLAFTLSWVVTADLAEIVASVRHPDGAPLFDPNRTERPPGR